MPEQCGNIKAVLEDIQGKGLSSTAKLVAILEACGITDREEVERLIECGSSTLRTAKSALKNERSKSSAARNQAPENERERSKMSETLENERQNSSAPSRAGATKESLRDTSSLEVKKIPQTPKFDFDVPRVRFADGRLTLNAELRKFWLDEFANDTKRLDLALIEIGGRIQPNNSRPLEAQVSSQLARIVADRRDRDQRYQSAVVANAAAKASPRPVKLSRW